MQSLLETPGYWFMLKRTLIYSAVVFPFFFGFVAFGFWRDGSLDPFEVELLLSMLALVSVVMFTMYPAVKASNYNDFARKGVAWKTTNMEIVEDFRSRCKAKEIPCDWGSLGVGDIKLEGKNVRVIIHKKKSSALVMIDHPGLEKEFADLMDFPFDIARQDGYRALPALFHPFSAKQITLFMLVPMVLLQIWVARSALDDGYTSIQLMLQGLGAFATVYLFLATQCQRESPSSQQILSQDQDDQS